MLAHTAAEFADHKNESEFVRIVCHVVLITIVAIGTDTEGMVKNDDGNNNNKKKNDNKNIIIS